MASRFPGIPGGDATASFTDDRYGVGKTYEYYDSTYGWRTVKFMKGADVTITAGMVVYFGSALGTVTPDFTGGTGTVMACGVAIGGIAIGSYGFIVCGFGDRCLLNTDGGVAALAEPLVGHSTNGAVDTMATDEEEFVFAVSTAADSTPGNQVVAIIVRGA